MNALMTATTVDLNRSQPLQPGLWASLRADARLLGRSHKSGWKRVAVASLNRGMHAIVLYRVSHWFAERRVPVIPSVLTRIAQHLFAVDIDPRAQIGPGLVLVHCFGIVIGSSSRIDGDCVIFHGVTLGDRGSEWVGSSRQDGHPHVGVGCILGAGAKLIGPIRVGNHCVVGANSVVLADVADHCVVAGIPARTISQRPEMDENLRPIHGHRQDA